MRELIKLMEMTLQTPLRVIAVVLLTHCTTQEARLRRSEKDHSDVFKHFSSSSDSLTLNKYAYLPASYFTALPVSKGKGVVSSLVQRIATVSWRAEGSCNAVTEEVSCASRKKRSIATLV